MKTWEMIKELTENPKKEFRLKEVKSGEVYADDEGVIRFSCVSGIYLEDEWEEVKKPVTWQEAFKAGLEGKRIKPWGQNITFPSYESLDYVIPYLAERPVYYTKIMLGKWYIED